MRRRINDARALAGTSPRRPILLVAALAAFAGLVLAGSAGSAPSTKYYQAGPATSNVQAGVASPVTITITNCGGTSNPCAPKASTQYLGSAKVTFPSGFAVTPGSVTAPPGKSWSVLSASGTSIILGNAGSGTTMALAPGQAVNVSASVTAPLSSCGSQSVGTQVKQSNDFNGSGNDFTNTAPNPQLSVSGALDHFELATVGNQVAGVGFKVTATAWDTCGLKKTDYAGGATLGGTLTSPLMYGTFAVGSFMNVNAAAQSSDTVATKAEAARTLTATAASQAGTSPASNPFNVTAGPPYSATFIEQPTDSQVNTAITPAVTVEAKDQYGNLAGGYQLALAITTGTGASGATLTGGGPSAGTTTDVMGVATFSSLSLDKVAGPMIAGTTEYTLDAEYGGVKLETAASATSNGFSIDLVATDCDPSETSCTLPQQNLPSPRGTTTTLTATATDLVDGGFTGIAFNLASPTPGNVVAAGGGCAYFQSSGAAGVLLEIRPFAQGVLEIEYGIPTKLIQALPNNGNKFVPICARSRRVDSSGTPINCTTEDPASGWMGRALDTNGVLTATLRKAVCDAATGEWWGILGTYQDPIDPATNPLITAWTSGTAPDGTNLRIFTIEVPAPWDWGHSG